MIIPLQNTNYYFGSILANLIDPTLAAPTLLAAAKVGLGTAAITPGLTTTIADLVEASFTGYAESATVVWKTPINAPDTTPTTMSPLVLFAASGSAVANQINNVFVTDGVASPSQGILASGVFPAPISIANTGDGFGVIIEWNLNLGNGELAATIIQS